MYVYQSVYDCTYDIVRINIKYTISLYPSIILCPAQFETCSEDTESSRLGMPLGYILISL